MDFVGDVGEVFVVDWAFSVGRALGKGENQYWPSNYIGAGDIDTWGCEGFVGVLGHVGVAVTAWASPSFFFAPPAPGLLLP